MNPPEFRQARRQLGLSVGQLALELQVHPRTIQRWQEGTQSLPGPVALAMRMLIEKAAAPTP